MYYRVVKKLYDLRALTLKQVFELVENKKITAEQFYLITDYNFEGIKEIWGQ